jgi:deoxyribonuclease IV
MIFGSHCSIAGGYHKAFEEAKRVGCDCMQIFVTQPRRWPTNPNQSDVVSVQGTTKNDNQWNCQPIASADAELFAQTWKESRIGATIAHTSYLINLASPDESLWQKSLDALIVEWQRAEQLKLEGLVMHPGAHLKATVEEGLERVAKAVDAVITLVKPKHCRLLLENTAGQGSCLGHQIEQLGWLLKAIKKPQHVGVCWDTCHALAAGYDFRTAAGMKSMVAELEKYVGLENLRAVHINDSKKDCGSRVDRHEHIGLGFIGEAGFKRFLASPAFKDLPMYLETAKEKDEASGEEWDVINLRKLRELCKK